MKENYLNDRVNDQINWYDTKSQKNKKAHITLKIISIIGSILIPFTASINIGNINCQNLLFAVSILGLLVAICEGISGVMNYHDKWQKYRTTCESLKHQKYLYESKSGVYAETDAESKFVENIERLISQENSSWETFTKKQNL